VTSEGIAQRSFEPRDIAPEPPRWRSRLAIAIAAIVIVLLGIAGGVAFSLIQHKPPWPFAGAANSALAGGLGYRVAVADEPTRVGAASTMWNLTRYTLEVRGPFRISGTGQDSGVDVRYAGVFDEPAENNYSILVHPGEHTDNPDPLKLRATNSILKNQHVIAAFAVEIDCARWSVRGDWPSESTLVSLDVAEFEAPATYAFSALFGPSDDIRDYIRASCASK